MVKSSLKKKIAVLNSSPTHTRKNTLREIIKNKIHKYSKITHQPFVSRFRLFEELHKIHNNKTLNKIKYYLKITLTKLLEERVLIKHKDSYRFSKVYLNNETKKLLKIKQKHKLKLKSNTQQQTKRKINKVKTLNAKAVDCFSSKSKAIGRAETIAKVNKQMKNPYKKVVVFKNASNGNDFISLNSTTTQQLNKSIKKGYKKIHPAIWQYFDNNKVISNPSHDGWYNYDAEASDIVEDAWQKYVVHRGLNDVRSVKSGEWEYMVDFMNWKQMNIIHTAHTKRDIRRLDEKGNITKNPYQ